MQDFLSLFWFLILVFAVLNLPGGEPSLHRRFLFDGQKGKSPIAIKQPTYTAAVYNHHAVVGLSTTFVTSHHDAVLTIDKNLEIYEQQAVRARSQGADILVFAEYGIYGTSFSSRHEIYPFLESIPDPQRVIWNPCMEKNRFENTEVQQRLSCMARNNSLYIVANMGDKHACSRTNDSLCKPDGRYQFNTNVVFDPNGTLIARYHKRNLYGELRFFDYPREIDLVSFDTPFGRFATFTCFDSLFHDPAVAVIEKYNIDSVVFPTHWVETPPFFSAIQWQAAFADGMKVNFLAANYASAGGSGIYTPTGPVVVADKDQPGKLLVATIPSRSEPFPAPQNKPTISRISTTGVYSAVAFGDRYNFVDLNGGKSLERVCSGMFCCQANYTLTRRNNEVFSLGVFSGVHRQIARAGLQICALMQQCVRMGHSECGHAASTFEHLVMSGTFTTKYVFPEILVNSGGKKVLPGHEWQYSHNILSSKSGFSKPLLSAVLLGRIYSQD